MLRFSHHDWFIEIDASIEGDHDDAKLQLRVHSNGYSGQATTWVEHDELVQFCKALAMLNKSLRGEANLSSMSPKELTLSFKSVTSRGHLAIHGSIGHQAYSEHSSFWHSVTFGFEFEQSQLGNAMRESWIARHAA